MKSVSILVAGLIFLLSIIAGAAVIDHKTAPVSVIYSDAQGVALHFDHTGLTTESVEIEEQSYQRFSISEEGYTGKYGLPMLPAVSRFVIVEPNRGLELEIDAGTSTTIPADLPPEICLELPTDGQTQDNLPILSGLYPPQIAEISEPVVMRGIRMVRVTTFPVQYDYDNNTYIIRDNIQANVVYNDDEPINPALQPIRRNRSPHFLKFIDGLAINGDEVGRDDPDNNENLEYIGHYLMVVHQNCLPLAAPWIEYKRQAGWKVDILRLTNNEAQNSNTIKERIQARYNAYRDEGVDPFDHILIIGDHASYENAGPGQEWVVVSPRGRPLWGSHDHYDWWYACLEGNDDYADVAISRWISGSQGQMTIWMTRQMGYEVNPPMQNPAWFTRAGVYAQRWGGNYHISLATNVRWAKHVMERIGMTNVRVYENMDNHDASGALVVQFLRQQFNDGVNLLVGRAENYGWRHEFSVQRTGIYPIDLNIAGHHEWTCWHMLRNMGVNDIKGPVAASTGWGGPATLWNSIVWLEGVNGFFLRDQTWGWARIQAVISPDLYIPNFTTQVFPNATTDIVFYGDPGLRYWRGVPIRVTAQHNESVMANDKLIEARVMNEQGDQPVAGAQVTIYVPGNMPAFDNANYATYDGMLMKTALSDDDGRVRFVFSDDVNFTGQRIHLTVTGRDILPLREEISIANPNRAISLAEYALTEIEGNNNGTVNPNETFDLLLTAQNIDRNNAATNVTAVVASNSPYLEIEQDQVAFGNINANSAANANEQIRLRVLPDCPDGSSRPNTKPDLEITFRSDQGEWKTALQLNPAAPNFIVTRVIGGNMIRDGANNLDVEIQNIGSISAPAVSARLMSGGMGVSVMEPLASYRSLAPGQRATINGNVFIVSGNRVVVPGSTYNMILILTTETGFVDTAHFELQVNTPRANAPGGPDPYGYVVFDDTDRDWDIAPRYEWTEINPNDNNAEFEGTRINFTGQSPNNIGEIRVINLGFETQFYGEVYNQISVATNGFIAMGSQDYVTNFQNWPLDRGIGGGVGMIAPLWDNLVFRDNQSGVYYYYDEETGRGIIEWYRLRHREGGNTDLHFQVVLHDRRVWITESGDQNIVFQYKNVTNLAGQNDNWSNYTPYASVGISSPKGYGINYTFNNRYPVTSAVLQDRRAILFATSPRYRTGVLYGRILDHVNDQPVQGVMVFTGHGFTATTDANGEWRIDDALAEVPFNLTAMKHGYNDSTLVDLIVEEDGELEVNISLLHPEFLLSRDGINAQLMPDETIDIEFQLENQGNGPLSWWVDRELPGDANAEAWQLRHQIPVGLPLDDNRVQGVVFVNEHFYVAGANYNEPQIYVLDRNGELVRQFDQSSTSRYGYADLAWDGELIWGTGERTIYGFTPEGELIHSWNGPNDTNNNLAWDSDRGIMYISGVTTNIYRYDREGNNLGEALPRQGLRQYGLAYWPEDRDGYNLYIFNNPSDTIQLVHKMNPLNGDTVLVSSQVPPGGGRPAACQISNQYDVYSWVFIALSNPGAEDRIDIWQLGPRREWFALEPSTGLINTGETEDLTLTFNSQGLPSVTFDGRLVFYHNAIGGRTIVPVSLDVIGGRRIQTINLNLGWNLVSLNVEPDQLNIEDLLQPMTELGILEMAKDATGNFYLPDIPFNNIGDWNPFHGYYLNLREDFEWQVNGLMIPGDTPIPLAAGWNIVSYLPRHTMHAEIAFYAITDDLELAKDIRGNFYSTEWDFSNMGELIEGNAYQLKMYRQSVLAYPMENQAAAVLASVNPSLKTEPQYYNITPHSSDNMSVLLLSKPNLVGWEAGVFDQDHNLIGTGVFDHMGRCGLAVWGSKELDRQPLNIRLWDGTTEHNATLKTLAGEFLWTLNGLTVAEISAGSSIPLVYDFQGIYPNPFNDMLRVNFSLVEDNMVNLAIYDITGRKVDQLVSEKLTAGMHVRVWNAERYPAGIYLLRLETAGHVRTQKVALIK